MTVVFCLFSSIINDGISNGRGSKGTLVEPGVVLQLLYVLLSFPLRSKSIFSGHLCVRSL